MTPKEQKIVHELKLKLFIANYPTYYKVSREEYDAAEKAVCEWLKEMGHDPFIKCGEYGMYFKGVQLVNGE